MEKPYARPAILKNTKNMKKPKFYQYVAECLRVIDGDTIIATINVGFDVTLKKYVRLHGINAPELNSTDPATRISAQASKDFLSSVLPVGTEFWVDSKKLDPYKRPIAVIYLPKNLTVSVNQMMIDAGHAVKA